MAGESWRARLARRDPDQGDLRKGLRVALVLPLMFAASLEVLDDEPFALFGAFGVFAMLVFADFGGPLASRARGYVVFALVGALIVTVGTLASQLVVVAAVGTFVVIFLIQQLSAFGGYWAAATIPATLAFVLAVMIPAEPSQIPPQAAGWLVAGLLSALSAVVLWPRRTRRRLVGGAADVADSMAGLLTAWEEQAPLASLEASAHRLCSASEQLIESWEVTRLRPAGPTSKDRAFTYLLEQVRQLPTFAQALVEEAKEAAGFSPDDRRLAVAARDAMSGTAELLRGGQDELELESLAGLRSDDLDLLEGAVSGALARADGRAAVLRVEQSFAVRMLVHATLSMAANARLMAGGNIDAIRDFQPPPMVPPPGSAPFRRGLRLVRSRLSIHSTWFHNSLRAAVAITAAVVLARIVDVEHGFWVALGTLSVLRSNAAGTASNALQAVAGTVIGFLVATPFFFAMGGRTALLWVVLPITTFLAAWAPRVVHFVAGQAAFTLFVIVLFNLVDPQGIQTGLVRVQDIFLGVVVAVGVGVLFWPRGVGVEIAAALGRAYRDAATYLESSFAFAIKRAQDASSRGVDRAKVAASESIADADEAIMLARSESGSRRVPLDELDQLLAGVARLRHTGDGLGWIRSGLPPLVGCDQVRSGLERRIGELCGSAREVGATLEGRSSKLPVERPVSESSGDLVEQLVAELDRDPGGTDATTVMSLVFAASWVQIDEQVLGEAEPFAGAVAGQRARRPDG